MSRLALTLTVLVLLALPRLAAACPTCAVDNQDGIGRLMMLGGMIALPFLIALAVIGAVRRALRDQE